MSVVVFHKEKRNWKKKKKMKIDVSINYANLSHILLRSYNKHKIRKKNSR